MRWGKYRVNPSSIRCENAVFGRVLLASRRVPGVPSLNRFLIQGWETTNLRSSFPLPPEPEPMCEPLDINLFRNANGSCSLPEVRRLPLSYFQLLSKASAAGRGRSKKQRDEQRSCVTFKDSEVNMRQPAFLFVGAATSHMRFAVMTVLLAFTTLPLIAQDQPIPAELPSLQT